MEEEATDGQLLLVWSQGPLKLLLLLGVILVSPMVSKKRDPR